MSCNPEYHNVCIHYYFFHTTNLYLYTSPGLLFQLSTNPIAANTRKMVINVNQTHIISTNQVMRMILKPSQSISAICCHQTSNQLVRLHVSAATDALQTHVGKDRIIGIKRFFPTIKYFQCLLIISTR